MPFVQAAGEAEAEDVLTRILRDEAGPVVSDILRYKARACGYNAGQQLQDVEDIRGEIYLRLVRQLQKVRADDHTAPIASFRDYVAVVTYNAFHEYLRKKHPAWACLKNRLQYLLTHDDGFSIWRGHPATQLCGLRSLEGEELPAGARSRLDYALESPATLSEEAFGRQDPARLDLRVVLEQIFRWMAAPIELDLLVTVVARATGITTGAPAAVEIDEGSTIDPPDTRPDVGTELEQRTYLMQVWSEICGLPIRQRVALLLNLDEIHSLPTTGVARIRQIAEVLGMPVRRLAELWKDLPVEDAVIAQHLGVQRWQVVNLRKAARDRLARRMKKNRACHAV